MPLRRNRYDPASLLLQLARQKPTRDVNAWCFKFACKDPQLDAFCVYLSDSEKAHEREKELLQDFLGHIQSLDNLVQSSFEAEYDFGGIALDNFMLHIGWMGVGDQTMTVRYWGTAVNTESESVFTRTDKGVWERSEPYRPMYRKKRGRGDSS